MLEGSKEIVAIVTGIVTSIAAMLVFFKRKPATTKEEAEVKKIKIESEILKKNIREESVGLIRKGYESILNANKDMIEAQEHMIQNLIIQINDVKKEVEELRKDNKKLWEENGSLRKRLSATESKLSELKKRSDK